MNSYLSVLRRAIDILAIVSILMAALASPSQAHATNAPQPLPYAQDWSNIGLITTNDDWSGVPGIIGFRGDGLTSANDVNPQTVLADETTVDVNANQTNPNTFATGGVAEFHLTNPVIALQGSGTADAPFLLLHLNTTGWMNITIAYNLRDIDGSTDNAVQQVAVQYRVGASGLFTNLPAGYVADATSGPSLATLVTPVSVILPADTGNQPIVQVRIITSNASGNDEWVGIDDLTVTGSAVPTPTNPSGSGAASPATVLAGWPSLLTAAITPGDNPTSTGIAASCDLTPIGGSSAQPLFDNATNGDVSPGDNTFSFSATVAPGTSAGGKTLPCVITDAQSRSGSFTISLNVVVPLPIGTVQGSVADGDDGLAHRSSYAPPSGNGTGQTVTVQGVIYEKTLARTSAGGSQNGFFLQNTQATADGDPNSSDGIFVFMGGFPDLIGGYVPQIGDEVVIQGRVSEFFFLTELSSARALVVVRSGVDLAAEVPAFEVDPPDILEDANRYWERHEGMRAQVPANSIVIDSRDVFASTLDGEVWLARGDSEIAQRPEPYERRVFRDPHPLDNDPALFDDGNGYRIILGSLGLKAAAGNNSELIAPARVFDTMSNAPIGGVYFSFGKYQIMVEQQLDLIPGVDPSLNALPQSFDRTEEYSIATYNVENLYDRRDDPFDGCDFTGNPGCPGVSPPFDYVPASQAIYEAHLNDIAQQIFTDLHGPDILLVQEAEDQDICAVSGDTLACGVVNDADGKPDTLQELALAIAALGGPAYEAVYDRDGADDRGIVSAILFRTDRVELLPASAEDPVLGSGPTVSYRGAALPYNTDIQNPKALNADLPEDVDISTGVDGSNVFTRPPQVGLFRMWREGIGTSLFVDVYVLSNHFSSTPNARVGQRTEQALYNAAVVDALQAALPEVLVVVGGDLNVYPRPDDPFIPGDSLYPSDQLGPLYDQGLFNLWDSLVDEVPASAYSYIFQGQTQTLDQIFLTPSLMDAFIMVRAAHVNSDWPADYDGDGARGASDHDPQVGRVSIVTLEGLVNLLNYYAEAGAITGNNTLKNLMGHLDRAAGAQAKGNQSQFEAQLQAFANQVLGYSPGFVTPEAAEALSREANLLGSMG